MREEVLSQMETERTTASTADAVSGHPSPAEPGSAATAGSAGTTTASGFRFAALGKELVVAGVFVRVYNEQPNFPVADPAAFCKGLVTFIHAHMKPEVSSQSFCYSAVFLILMHVTITAPLLFAPIQSINQSIYISCLWDSSGESTDNNWENNIHYALNVQGVRQ